MYGTWKRVVESNLARHFRKVDCAGCKFEAVGEKHVLNIDLRVDEAREEISVEVGEAND